MFTNYFGHRVCFFKIGNAILQLHNKWGFNSKIVNQHKFKNSENMKN